MSTANSSLIPNGGCVWCNSPVSHRVESCPMVSAVEYHPDGSLKRVEKARTSYLPQPGWRPPVITYSTAETVSSPDATDTYA